MVEQALDTFGGLHAVINPAGILRDVMFHKMSEDDWDRVIDVHMRGSFNVARATIELFREQNDGAYMFFTSTSGLFGNIGQANYGAAKMGIAGLSRIIAMEGARNNVRSNCLAPVAWTRMTQSVPVKDEAAAARRALTGQWILFANASFGPAMLQFASRPEELQRLLTNLDGVLARGEHLLAGSWGDPGWGAADCAVQAYLAYLPMFCADLDLSPYPRVQALIAATTARPSYARVMGAA